MQVDMANQKPDWGASIVPANRIVLTDAAEAKIVSFFQYVAQAPEYADHIVCLGFVVSSARYSAEGVLESTIGPHIGIGLFERAQVPADCVVKLLGHDCYLRLSPFSDGTEVQSLKIDLIDGVLFGEYDPPAPYFREREHPKTRDFTKPPYTPDKDGSHT